MPSYENDLSQQVSNSFRDVFADIRFPIIAVDISLLREFIQKQNNGRTGSEFTASLRGIRRAKREALLASLRGLFSKTEMSAAAVMAIASTESMRTAEILPALLAWTQRRFRSSVAEINDDLVWTEQSPWPFAFSTVLQQYMAVMRIHMAMIEKRVEDMTAGVEAKGFAPENLLGPLSEFPRQLPTHQLYAMASLGAWLGGAMNVQYFAYYATIRQIFHSSLNLTYGKKIGFEEHEAKAMDQSGIVSIPENLVRPLLVAQGTPLVFGSIQIDEENTRNPPSIETTDPKNHKLPGFMVDKFYRAPFRARSPRSQALYGSQNILRDHYEEFYAGLPKHTLLRCKHHCVPLIDVTSREEIARYVNAIPVRNSEGIFLRGQRKLYQLERHTTVQGLLFGESCSVEPSLVTTASREPGFDYDKVHYALRTFLEDEVLGKADGGRRKLIKRWREEALDPLCRLDYAVVALAQHYGIPTHGLDVTTNPDVALWFATNLYTRDNQGIATYTPLTEAKWPASSEDWPVIAVCQMVTNSIGQSLHDCQELMGFGFEAHRPKLQSARFFFGGHSDHQNRLAEAVVCFLRLSPETYTSDLSFDQLFPAPKDDPAYEVMLRFATSRLGQNYGRFVNRFH